MTVSLQIQSILTQITFLAVNQNIWFILYDGFDTIIKLLNLQLKAVIIKYFKCLGISKIKCIHHNRLCCSQSTHLFHNFSPGNIYGIKHCKLWSEKNLGEVTFWWCNVCHQYTNEVLPFSFFMWTCSIIYMTNKTFNIISNTQKNKWVTRYNFEPNE